MTHSLVAFKLTTGEEIIARLVDETKFEIEKPHILAMQPTPHGVQMGFMPWMPLAGDSPFCINRDSIVAHVSEDSIPKQFRDAYIQQTTGITLATP